MVLIGLDWIGRLRLGSGLVLFAFVGTHLLNHVLGLISLAALEAGREVFLTMWRNPIGTTLLYGVGATVVALGTGSSGIWEPSMHGGNVSDTRAIVSVRQSASEIKIRARPNRICPSKKWQNASNLLKRMPEVGPLRSAIRTEARLQGRA